MWAGGVLSTWGARDGGPLDEVPSPEAEGSEGPWGGDAGRWGVAWRLGALGDRATREAARWVSARPRQEPPEALSRGDVVCLPAGRSRWPLSGLSDGQRVEGSGDVTPSPRT